MSDRESNETDESRAQSYSRVTEWFVLIGWLWSFGMGLLALASGSSARLRGRVERMAPDRLGSAIPYAVVATIASFVTSLPLSYLRGFTIEHRYGLSNQSRGSWFVEQVKGLGVGLVLGAPLMQGIYAVIRRWPQRWWAIVAALTVPLSVIMATLLPVLVLPLFNKFRPLDDADLARRITDLAAREGVNVSAVLQMDMSKQTKKANAAFTGIGKTKRIILGDTLLEEFTPDEVEVVMAHELGHQVHRDIWKFIALSAPTSVIGLYAAHRLTPVLLSRFGKLWGIEVDRGVQDVAALPLLGLIGQVAMLGIGPVVNAVERRLVERPADRYALDLTQNSHAFIGAMEKLGKMNLANPKPSKLVKWLLHDHPPLGERIEFARTYRH